MNKITKRVVAGISAAALFVSALGSDALISLFNPTTYAASSGEEIGKDKNGKSTGFDNLEQDTNSDGYYNTGYGLHTNKTATEAGTDGRTFDVNLESWYVGENPVDVATILDASGSMAWTVDTLKPLEITDFSIFDSYTGPLSGVTINSIEDLKKIQEDNGGYLPQEVVDCILKPENTDNSKLSYSKYMYYVYEARSSVSEFVPLGYWDGGKPVEKFEPIGYYPFENTLENKAVDGDMAKLIKHAKETSGTFDENSVPTVSVEPSVVESDGDTLDIAKTAEDGALLADVKASSSFTIAMRVKAGEITNSGNSVDKTPLVYIGTGKSNYISVYRQGGGSDPRRLMVDVNGEYTENIGNVFQVTDKSGLGSDSWINISLTYDESTNKINLYLSVKGKRNSDSQVDTHFEIDASEFGLNFNDADIIIGGDVINKTHDNRYTKTQLTDFCVYNEALTSDEISELNSTTSSKQNIKQPNSLTFSDKLTAYYDFDDGNLENKKEDASGSLTFIEQAEDKTFSKTEIKSGEANPEYSSDSHSGSRALNVSQTAKLGAVLLDAAPTDSKFTLSFAVKKTKDSDMTGEDKVTANLLYIGDMNATDYYQIKRREGTSNSRLAMRDKDNNTYVNINQVFNNTNYKVITIVVDGTKVTQYKDGEEYTTETATDLKSEINADDLALIIGGLWDDGYNGSDILIDDLYVFDKALDADQVAAVAKATAGQTEFAKLPAKLADGCEGYHATMKDTDDDIAQIKDSLAQNPNDDERRGWYYVNSHSKWEDIEGCLASGKQYVGICTEKGFEDDDIANQMNKDTATVPSAYKDEENDVQISIKNGDTGAKKYNPPETERSIRFYVDSQNHLRCFAWSGGDTESKDDPRTFCSLVYEKGYNDDDSSEQITKYEELNNALNTFYQNLAEKSDLSNNAVVRFSTNSAVDQKVTETTNTNLKKLIMKDWTNWSDFYQTYKAEHSGTDPKTTDYLQDLLIPEDGETAVPTSGTEYPYVMTGGTYTWTGLKAFYDNMVKNEDSQTAKDIANDARDKYLIIFTDGRDNTQDYSVSELDAKENYQNFEDNMAGSPDYDDEKIGQTTFGKKNYVGEYNPYKGEDHYVGFSIKNYNNHWGWPDTSEENLVQKFVTEDHVIASDGDLAEAWADKLKDEGYTIYCVMMASGSISRSANEAEYNKAKNFLKSLSGSNELDAQIAQMQADNEAELTAGSTKPDDLQRQQNAIEELRDKYVIVVDPTVTGGMTVTDAFEQILEDIQLPRNDYTVQDYIDPRFDLIGEAYVGGNDKPQEVIYHLGANGKITFTDTNNKALDTITVTNPNGTNVTLTSGTTVDNIIDNIDKTGIVGLPYTPMKSYMVNRKATEVSVENPDGYNKGDGIGTGYIYYDNVKDMYYLRWTDQIIPMENEAFDTDTSGTGKKLDVWSATIRLKAKDDFIGGNDILTNGNEAGENLVYSDATIENMTDNPKLYFPDYTEGTEITYREKLAALSGTDRKINAVDAGGVSQAVYGDGIDIPSSGFPRTTVNVRLLKLDANNLNDVIYMGEVVSPTMMLADLENGYMTGSYYLQYLERYAYRVYGEKADEMPLIELLNKWLKIDDDEEAAKTFTIPYIYLPDPEYGEDGKLEIDEGSDKVKIQNSTGASWDGNNIDFADLNLRDVTGFITYTWKRDDGGEEQQKTGMLDSSGNPEYDVTIDYVVKNTDQIKYNLQLKFTPLKETARALDGFTLDTNFIKGKTSDETGDTFFKVVDGEFEEFDPVNDTDGWSTEYGRTDYLQAMINEERTYTPHVMYDKDADGGKWVLVNEDSAGYKPTDAAQAYKDADESEQTTIGSDDKSVIDVGVYDWTSSYKPAEGNPQIEEGQSYTNTPDNVYVSVDGFSLVANTTYTKDVVNAALALELFVDGKYLNQGLAGKIKSSDGISYTFDAVRYYDDPIDPPPYDKENVIGADTGEDGKKYRLTFKVDPASLPDASKIQENTIYKVWAKLEEVKVLDSVSGDYISIDTKLVGSTYDSIKSYLGYAAKDALPIGTYEIKTSADIADNNSLENGQFIIGKDQSGNDVKFKYLKIENDKKCYTYNRFPASVYTESDTAADITKDGEYLIKNDTKDNSKANIAENNRVKDSTEGTQTVTFYFGTVASKDVSEDITLYNIKGESVKDYLKEHSDDPTLTGFTNDYAKDRLGIIMLSADNNSLAISKKVTNTDAHDNTEWSFNVTVKPHTIEDVDEFDVQNRDGFDLKWYKLDSEGNWVLDETIGAGKTKVYFTEIAPGDGIYTATITLKHGEKVVISGLQDGTWQVEEVNNSSILYTPHNNANGEENWEYVSSNKTNDDELNPASYVDFINEFPYELPSAGGFGIVTFIVFGSLLSAAAAIFFVLGRRKAGYSAGGKECG